MKEGQFRLKLSLFIIDIEIEINIKNPFRCLGKLFKKKMPY